MTEKYKTLMNEMGYNHLVCDIFDNWEGVKDEILLQELGCPVCRTKNALD